MKRVGIIGCGSIFGVHARTVARLKNAELVALCDVEPVRLAQKSAEYGTEAFADYRAMIMRADLDVVHICTPHYLHAPMCEFALKNGVDVISEKPLTIRSADAEHLRQVSKDCGRRLGVVFQNRLNPGAVLVKTELDKGTLGGVLGARCAVCWYRDDSYYRQDSWRGKYETEGGGVVINQAIHTLDLMRWLIGREVLSVKAGLFHRGDTSVEVEDTAEGRVAFAGGIFGNFYFTTTNVCDAPVFLELYGEKGTARLIADAGEIVLRDGTHMRSADADNVTCGKDCWGNSHFRQLQAFYDDKDGAYWQDTLDEAVKTGWLVEKVYRAAGVWK